MPHVPVTGRSVRFAVGNPSGLSSDSWKVWTTRQGDIYLACRDINRDCKISLHASGAWRLAYLKEAFEQGDVIPDGADRVIERWERPSGWGEQPVAGFRVVVTSGGLYRTPGDRTGWTRTTVWVDPRIEIAEATVISVYGVPNGQTVVEPPGVLAVLDLVEGMKAHVVAWQFETLSGFEEIGEAVVAETDPAVTLDTSDIVLLHGQWDGAGMMTIIPLGAMTESVERGHQPDHQTVDRP